MRNALNTTLLAWAVVAMAACGESSSPAVDNGPGIDVADVAQIDATDVGGDEGRDSATEDPGAEEGQDVPGDQAVLPDADVVQVDVPDSDVVACKDGGPCDDGNACTWGEICAAGVCAGGTVYT